MKNISKFDIIFFLWIASLMTLPFDSFPFIKTGYIKPLSFIPMGLMLFSVFLAVLIGRKKIFLNNNDIIFILFALYILINSLFQLLVLQNAISPTGITPLRRFLEVFYFLPLMMIFYFTPRLAILDIKKLGKTYRWLLIAFILPLGWGIFQSIFIFAKWNWYDSIFRTINESLASREGYFEYRIAMFSSEPAAASYQLMLLLIPVLFFCIHFDFSFFKKVSILFMKIRIEVLLILFAVFCLVMTVSITGFFAAMVFLLFYFIFFLKKKIFYRNISIILLVIIILMTISYSYLKPLIERLNLLFLTDKFNIILILSQDQSTGVRYIHWIISIKEFLTNILFGVGFRNTLFYYSDLVPDWAARFGEIQMYLTTSNPTPKGFFQGILGELGLIGLGLYLILYIRLIQQLKKVKPVSNLLNVIKYSLLFSLILVVPMGISTDFNYPYFWLIFGLTSAFVSVNNTYKNKD